MIDLKILADHNISCIILRLSVNDENLHRYPGIYRRHGTFPLHPCLWYDFMLKNVSPQNTTFPCSHVIQYVCGFTPSMQCLSCPKYTLPGVSSECYHNIQPAPPLVNGPIKIPPSNLLSLETCRTHQGGFPGIGDLCLCWKYHPFPLKEKMKINTMGQVTELELSCYLVLLSIDSKTR